MENIYPRVILGLDVSTACIGVSIVEDSGNFETPKIIAITHKSPKVSSKIKGIENLMIKKRIFSDEFLKKIDEYLGGRKLTDIIIEEPLISSNNANTVATLLRFNGMIADSCYEIFGIVPNFISSYDAREYSFPELVSLRKYNRKGECYTLKDIKKCIKKNHIVLFGDYNFDADKKNIMMDMVNKLYKGENAIPWLKDKHGNLKKENYDACDSLVCTLAYININRYGLEKPVITEHDIYETVDERYVIRYTIKIWDKMISKELILNN